MSEESREQQQGNERPKVVLKPCSGNVKAGTSDGHMWNASVNGADDGWYTRSQAQRRYPRRKYQVIWSNSSTICDSCAAFAFGRRR